MNRDETVRKVQCTLTPQFSREVSEVEDYIDPSKANLTYTGEYDPALIMPMSRLVPQECCPSCILKPTLSLVLHRDPTAYAREMAQRSKLVRYLVCSFLPR